MLSSKRPRARWRCSWRRTRASGRRCLRSWRGRRRGRSLRPSTSMCSSSITVSSRTPPRVRHSHWRARLLRPAGFHCRGAAHHPDFPPGRAPRRGRSGLPRCAPGTSSGSTPCSFVAPARSSFSRIGRESAASLPAVLFRLRFGFRHGPPDATACVTLYSIKQRVKGIFLRVREVHRKPLAAEFLMDTSPETPVKFPPNPCTG